MKRLVLSGQNQEQLRLIKSELEPLLKSLEDIKITSIRPPFLQTGLDETCHVVVFDVSIITKMIFPLVVKMRKTGFSGPIVFLGKKSPEFDRKELAANRAIYLLEKPYEPEQLQGLVKNCINIEDMRGRRDQRFDVREHATIQAYSSDFQMETTICNISRSGVRIEGNMEGLKQGDLLRLHFNFEKIQKQRTMSARVVWKKENADKMGEAGLEFVSQKLVYQYLLDYAVA